MLNLIQVPSLLRATGMASNSRPLSLTEVAALPPPAGPPPRALGFAEARASLQLPRLLLAGPRLLRAPRGDGSVVVDVPGWLAPEASNAPIRLYLRALGWDARGWGLGTNTGNPEHDALRLADVVTALARVHGPVALVGWSLGGVVAREVAREHPDAVRRVVTFGTPVTAGPKHTAAAERFGKDECDRIERLSAQLDFDAPIGVPVTAILTKDDGVVSWLACVDRASHTVDHVEVRSTHLGLGLDPDVWLTVARALAQGQGGSPKI